MKKFINFLTFIIIFAILITRVDIVLASDSIVSNSATLSLNISTNKYDYRKHSLKKYLIKKGSPLKNHVDELIEKADEHNLDWRLIAAISGVESNFGKRIPPNSFNAYGWANGKWIFESWNESIDIISYKLRSRYYDKGAVSIERIGKIYAPPSNSWSWKVKYFINDIDPILLPFSIY